MAEGLRVLYVIDSLAPGGAETSLAAMAPGLTDHRIELHVAYFSARDGLHDELRTAGATLHHVVGSRLGRLSGLRSLIRDLAPDVVHTTLYEADQAGRLAARLTHVPVLSSLVSTGFDLGSTRSLSGIKSRAALAVDIASARLVTRFHAVSEPVAEVMARRLHIAPSKFEVIPRGRNDSELGRRSDQRRSTTRRQLGIDDHTPLVLAIGRHVPPKDHRTLIAAFQEVHAESPDARLMIAGQEGSETVSLKAQIAATGLDRSIDLLGRRSDVADLICAADVIAHPSRREGFPGTLVEALALECPIVATDIASIRSVVGPPEAVACRLVGVGEPIALAASIVATLSGKRDEAGLKRGRQRFERSFTSEAVAQRHVELYHAIAG